MGVTLNASMRYLIVGGKRVDIPKHIECNSITTLDGRIYVGGYELEGNGEWKRTFKAWWYKHF